MKEVALLDMFDRHGWRTLEFPGNKAVQGLLRTLLASASPGDEEVRILVDILKKWVQVKPGVNPFAEEGSLEKYNQARLALDEHVVKRQKRFGQAFKEACEALGDEDWASSFPKPPAGAANRAENRSLSTSRVRSRDDVEADGEEQSRKQVKKERTPRSSRDGREKEGK